MGAPDLFHANLIAREMILGLGMGRRTGPLDLMRASPNEGSGGDSLTRTADAFRDSDAFYYHSTDMSTEQVGGGGVAGGGGLREGEAPHGSSGFLSVCPFHSPLGTAAGNA